MIIHRYLEKWNFNVAAFQDPFRALESFEKNSSLFSLILSDVRMPGTDGIHLAKEIAKVKPATQIIMMTTFEMDDDICRDLPSVKKEEILHKPFRVEQMCLAVKKRLDIKLR
jgi:DNA-binding NtrC family response regulator